MAGLAVAQQGQSPDPGSHPPGISVHQRQSAVKKTNKRGQTEGQTVVWSSSCVPKSQVLHAPTAIQCPTYGLTLPLHNGVSGSCIIID